MSFRAMGGAFWHDDQYGYSEYWLDGPNRENDLKLAEQQIRQDADARYYKGEGCRIVDLTVTRSKDRITIKVKTETTTRKRRKRKR